MLRDDGKPQPPKLFMKSPSVDNIVVDEAHALTYVVKAAKVLTDGEIYTAIRRTLLKHGRPTKGQKVVINLG